MPMASLSDKTQVHQISFTFTLSCPPLWTLLLNQIYFGTLFSKTIKTIESIRKIKKYIVDSLLVIWVKFVLESNSKANSYWTI